APRMGDAAGVRAETVSITEVVDQNRRRGCSSHRRPDAGAAGRRARAAASSRADSAAAEDQNRTTGAHEAANPGARQNARTVAAPAHDRSLRTLHADANPPGAPTSLD